MIAAEILDRLTKAERKIFDLYSVGLRPKESAAELNLAPKTVSNRLSDIKKKLGAEKEGNFLPVFLPRENCARNRLTEKEKIVLDMYAKGKTANIIARELNIHPETVKTHIRNLTNKLGREEVQQIKNKTQQIIANTYANTVTEEEELKRVLVKDPGFVRLLFKQQTEGSTTKEEAVALAASSAGNYRNKVMSENGKLFKIMSQGKHKKTVFVPAEERPRISNILKYFGLKPARTSPEGDAIYLLTSMEYERVKRMV